jgi:hypothetical protein
MPAMRRPLFASTEDLVALDALMDEWEGDLSRAGEMEASLTEWMDLLGDEEGVKLDGYVAWLKQLEMEEAAAKAQAEQWKAKADSRYRRAYYLKYRLKQHLEATGRTKIETDSGHSISICSNGGKIPVVLADPLNTATIPDHLVIVRREPNKDAIRAALEDGQELSFASLGERGTHIRVK